MKKYLHLALLLFAFAFFAKAQCPASTANWFGYILPSSPAEYKYVSFTMQDLGSVSIASDFNMKSERPDSLSLFCTEKEGFEPSRRY